MDSLPLGDGRSAAGARSRGSLTAAGESPLPRRILHVCEDLSQGGAAGQQQVISQIATHLDGAGSSVAILGPVRGGRAVAPDLKRYVRHPLTRGVGPAGIAALWKAIRSADVVHIHGVWAPVGVVAAWLCRVSSTPYVVTPHGMLQPWLLRRRRWRKQFHLLVAGRALIRYASVVHCITAREARVVQRIARRALRIRIIPNSIPAEHLTQAVDRAPTAGREPIALFVGRLDSVKGVVPLIEAWTRIWPSFRTWRLEIIGEDTAGLREGLERRLGHGAVRESVRFVDPRPWVELARHYDGASLFVLPSFTEVIGLVNLEAAGRALPIVTTRATGLDYLTRYGGGVMCRPSPESIAAALAQLMRLSDEARRTMGLAARAMVRDHFTWSRVAPAFEELYRGVTLRNVESGAGQA